MIAQISRYEKVERNVDYISGNVNLQVKLKKEGYNAEKVTDISVTNTINNTRVILNKKDVMVLLKILEQVKVEYLDNDS